MGSLPPDYPFCLMIDANRNPYWSELQYHQKLAYDLMLTKIKRGKGWGGVSCSSCKDMQEPIEVIETFVELNNKRYNYTFMIDHWARPICENDAKFCDGHVFIRLGDFKFHSVSTDPHSIPTIKTGNEILKKYDKPSSR